MKKGRTGVLPFFMLVVLSDYGLRPDPTYGWIGEEVSDDARYYNANLIRHPYSQW